MKRIMMSELDEYAKWMLDNNHEIETYQDYGDCGNESVQCFAKSCNASRYSWESDHIELFRLERKKHSEIF